MEIRDSLIGIKNPLVGNMLEHIIEQQKNVCSFSANGRTYMIEKGSDEIIVTDGLNQIPFDRNVFMADFQCVEHIFCPYADPTPKY